MEGMWLGANAPDRFDKMILSNCTAHYADKTMWHNRMDAVSKGGSVAAIADMVINAWLTQDFQKAHPDATAHMKTMMIATPVEGYLACCAAVRDMDHRDLLKRIKVPTLVIAGAKDPATNVAAAEFIRNNIPGAKLAIVDAAHIANVEAPEVYAKTVLDFLGSK
jgi:3-oxoadipate enol-lactonase